MQSKNCTRRLNALKTAQLIAKNRKEWHIRSLMALEGGAAAVGSRTWSRAKHSAALGVSRRFLEHIPHAPHAIAALAVPGSLGALAPRRPSTQKT